jgi:hypothetical protein
MAKSTKIASSAYFESRGIEIKAKSGDREIVLYEENRA